MKIKLPKDKQFFSNLILQRTDAFIKCGGLKILKKVFEDGSNTEILINFLLENKKYDVYILNTLKSYLKEVDQFIKFYNITNEKNIISIGPGNGIFELFLLKRIKFNKILLVDIENTVSKEHGFNEKGSGYSSLEDTKTFLINNNIQSSRIMTCNPKKEKLPSLQISLLFSLFSMGFHYPCNEYIEFIKKNSNKNSKIILDKRKNVKDDGFEILLKNFEVTKIFEQSKHNRILLTKF